jgi:light-regulated signal transduction histidine kinase (bacteriophytochrome)
MLPSQRQAPIEDGRCAAAELELQTFSYLVSHDVAASLRQVVEFSRLLVGEAGDRVADEQSPYLAPVRAAAAKSQLMMEQLLTFSRVQQRVMNRIQQAASPALKAPLLQLAIHLGEAGGESCIAPLGEVYADTELLTHAVGQLLDNAFKFRRPDVSPRISVEVVNDAAFWRLRITDNGIGIAPAYREKAFQMFRQLNAEGAYPGVGAGLAICRRIARRHGGEAAFVDCDEGTCVELALANQGSERSTERMEDS